jgi:hypothetical protein
MQLILKKKQHSLDFFRSSHKSDELNCIITIQSLLLCLSKLPRQGSRLLCLNAPFNTIFSYIDWRSVLLVEETGIPWENHKKNSTFNNSSLSLQWRFGLDFWCWTPLSTIFQLYRCCQFYWRRKFAMTKYQCNMKYNSSEGISGSWN